MAYAFLFAGIGEYVLCAGISAYGLKINMLYVVILFNFLDNVLELSCFVKGKWRMPFYLVVYANMSCVHRCICFEILF